MKKVIFVLAAVVLTMGYAQAQFTFGVRAGLNLTNISEKYDGEKPSEDERGKFKPGFQVGVVGEYAISDAFAIQPGIVFATQGARVKYSDTWAGEKEEFKASLTLNYIQVPINAQYKLDLGGAKLLLQAGPYLGLGIGGKAKIEETYGGETKKDDYKIKFGSGTPDEDTTYVDNAFDFGLGIGAGLQFSNIQVGLGYNLGLANMTDEDKSSSKNNGFALTVTYLFGK